MVLPMIKLVTFSSWNSFRDTPENTDPWGLLYRMKRFLPQLLYVRTYTRVRARARAHTHTHTHTPLLVAWLPGGISFLAELSSLSQWEQALPVALLNRDALALESHAHPTPQQVPQLGPAERATDVSGNTIQVSCQKSCSSWCLKSEGKQEIIHPQC